MKIGPQVLKYVERFVDLARKYDRYKRLWGVEDGPASDYYNTQKRLYGVVVHVYVARFSFLVDVRNGEIRSMDGEQESYCLNVSDFQDEQDWKSGRVINCPDYRSFPVKLVANHTR